MALHHPEHAASIQRVLAIPHKRTERNLVTYLTEPEVDALLEACDQTSWTGRRDHTMFALTIQAGLRISELAGLTCADITLSTGANVHTIGKGRKERRTPLVPATRKVLKAWLKERGGAPTDPSNTTMFLRSSTTVRIVRSTGLGASCIPISCCRKRRERTQRKSIHGFDSAQVRIRFIRPHALRIRIRVEQPNLAILEITD